MAPNAPDPTYNSHGTQVREWLVVVRYDAARDCLTLSWTQDGDQHISTSQGAMARPSGEQTEFVQDVADTIARLHAPRLW